MLVYEKYNELLTRAYSDKDVLIERDGIRYVEAIDPTELHRTYVETDIPIDPGEDTDADATLQDYQNAMKILGIQEG